MNILLGKMKNNQLFFLLTQDKNNLKNFVANYLKSKYETVAVSPYYVYAVGDIPIALAAHLDTVAPSPPSKLKFLPNSGIIYNEEGILGADDRAGVYSIIDIIQEGYRPSVIFTMDEESGCIGSSNLTDDFDKPLGLLKFIIQLDRRGKDDCVFYDCRNKDFKEAISTFGFQEREGTFSDISIICPAWDVAGVNLSVGYYNEHTSKEYLNINFLEATTKKVCDILTMEEFFDYYVYYPSKEEIGDNPEWFWWDCPEDENQFCSICGRPITNADKMEPYDDICAKCFNKVVNGGL